MLAELAVKRERVLASFFEDPLLTLEQTALAIGNVSVSTLRNWIHNGEVHGVRVGRKIMVPSTEIKRIRNGGNALK